MNSPPRTPTRWSFARWDVGPDGTGKRCIGPGSGQPRSMRFTVPEPGKGRHLEGNVLAEGGERRRRLRTHKKSSHLSFATPRKFLNSLGVISSPPRSLMYL